MANIAIVGATGLVGKTMLEALDNYDIKIDNLILYASEKSAGKTIDFKGKTYTVRALNTDIDETLDYALFSAGHFVSKTYAPKFRNKGIKVIDNSSAFRQDETTPLIVPEVNAQAISQSSLIANPNCSTIQAMLPLHVIKKLYGITHIQYVTLQAVSGAGYQGLEGLKHDGAFTDEHAIKDNVIPKIDVFDDEFNAYEEVKMIQESKKILNDQTINISATCIRVPVSHAHGVNITVQTKQKPDLTVLKETLKSFQGITFYEHPTYPTPQDARGKDDVLVGRLRYDNSKENSIHLWTVADNIKKGAATNAVQILKQLMEENHETI